MKKKSKEKKINQSEQKPVVQKSPGSFDFTKKNIPEEQVIKNFPFWKLLYNAIPYKVSVYSQTLLVPKRRVARFEDLNLLEKFFYPFVKAKVIKMYRKKWGCCFAFLRQQTEGSSVPQHLHEHFIWDDKEILQDFSTEEKRMEFQKFEL